MQYEFNDTQAAYLLQQVENDIFALHNYIAGAVETPGSYEASGGPQGLVRKLRAAEEVRMVLRRKLYPSGKAISVEVKA